MPGKVDEQLLEGGVLDHLVDCLLDPPRLYRRTVLVGDHVDFAEPMSVHPIAHLLRSIMRGLQYRQIARLPHGNDYGGTIHGMNEWVDARKRKRIGARD